MTINRFDSLWSPQVNTNANTWEEKETSDEINKILYILIYCIRIRVLSYTGTLCLLSNEKTFHIYFTNHNISYINKANFTKRQWKLEPRRLKAEVTVDAGGMNSGITWVTVPDLLKVPWTTEKKTKHLRPHLIENWKTADESRPSSTRPQISHPHWAAGSNTCFIYNL